MSTLLCRYPISLYRQSTMFQAEAMHNLYQQAVASRLEYGFDNQKVKELVLKAYRGKDYLELKNLIESSSELWILLSSP